MSDIHIHINVGYSWCFFKSIHSFNCYLLNYAFSFRHLGDRQIHGICDFIRLGSVSIWLYRKNRRLISLCINTFGTTHRYDITPLSKHFELLKASFTVCIDKNPILEIRRSWNDGTLWDVIGQTNVMLYIFDNVMVIHSLHCLSKSHLTIEIIK